MKWYPCTTLTPPFVNNKNAGCIFKYLHRLLMVSVCLEIAMLPIELRIGQFIRVAKKIIKIGASR